MLLLRFTNKAADELKNRLSFLIREKYENAKKSRDKTAISKWQKNFFQLHEANISTFHSFFKSIISEYAHLLNIDPDFNLITDYVKQKKLKSLFRAYANQKLIENDNRFQTVIDSNR